METTLQQLIYTDIEGEPLIAGTNVTVQRILENLAAGWFFGDIMAACNFPTEQPILAALEYVKFLPSYHPLALLLLTYRKKLNQKVKIIVAELKSYLKELYGLQLAQLILYGSQARGDASPDSDIDVLVVLNGAVDDWQEAKRTSQFVADLSLKYTVVVSTFFVSVDQLQTESRSFFRNVQREGIAI